jgi:hypothetical protein
VCRSRALHNDHISLRRGVRRSVPLAPYPMRSNSPSSKTYIFSCEGKTPMRVMARRCLFPVL